MRRGGLIGGALALAVTGAAFTGSLESASAEMAKALIDTKGDAATRPWKRYPGWPARDESKYNTLAHIASPPAPKEPRALPALTGDPAKGEKLVADRNRGGSCLACHVMGPAGGANLPGNVAPDLSEVGNLGLSDEQLYNFVYDARVYNPETVMPPWGGHGIFNDQEIMDMVAFLKTLKTPAAFKTALDDPSKRPPPVEKRENLDPIENPGMWAIDKAKELWKTRGPAGFACGTCHGNPEVSFKTWASTMPQWEPRLDKVLGVEEFVTRHARATTGANWLMETEENRAMSVYLHNLANGAPILVDVSSAPITGSAGSGWASPRASTITSRPGAPACKRCGTSGSASSGARSISAPTSCRRTPRNMATSSFISPRSTAG
jgi:sulfur-oxidizing protein SoxA